MSHPVTDVLRANIRAELARNAMNNSHLANLLGVAESTISRKINGLRPISSDEIGQFADALGLEPADLLVPPVRRLDLLNAQVAGNVNERVRLDANAPLAQLVEQQTLNLRVQGSSP